MTSWIQFSRSQTADELSNCNYDVTSDIINTVKLTKPVMCNEHKGKLAWYS